MTQRVKGSKTYGKGYQVGGGVPWPEFQDGTPYTPDRQRVRHVDHPDETGRVLWVKWTHPDGTHMDGAQRTDSKGRAKPGQWTATVAWDRRDEGGLSDTAHPLAKLVPEAPGT